MRMPDPEVEALRRELPGYRVERRRFADGLHLDVGERRVGAPRTVRRTAAEVREALAGGSPLPGGDDWREWYAARSGQVVLAIVQRAKEGLP